MKPTLYIISIFLIFEFGRISTTLETLPIQNTDTLFFSTELNDVNLLNALECFEAKASHIVLKQAKFESGNYTSRLAVEDKNIFGLFNSASGKYYIFEHWIESVLAYKNLVQRKYKGGDYYKFLEELPYASDGNYCGKVRGM
jgi:hypothetical protein